MADINVALSTLKLLISTGTDSNISVSAVSYVLSETIKHIFKPAVARKCRATHMRKR